MPFDAQGAVTSAYRAYLGLVLCLVYNCAAAFARLAANKVRYERLPPPSDVFGRPGEKKTEKNKKT